MKTAAFLFLTVLYCRVFSPLMAQNLPEKGPPSAGTSTVMDASTHASSPDSEPSLALFVEQALQASPRLQAARSRAAASAAKIDQAGAWDEPQVGVDFFATPITSANPFKDGMETDYFIQQMVPLFGKKGSMRDAATAEARMAEQSAVEVERKLVADVKIAYSMIYAAQRRIDVNAENQRLLELIVASGNTRYRVLMMSQSDLLKAQVEMAKLQNERAELDQQLSNAFAMMNALRALPPTAEIGRVQDPPVVKLALSREDLLARALEFRPELRAMGHELEMNRADLAASKADRLPDLMIRGMYKQMAEGTDQWSAMFSVNIPIAPWASGRTSGKVEEIELLERATEQSLAEMKRMVQAEVLDAYSKVDSRLEKIERFRAAILPQSEQSLQSALAAFQVDKVDFLSLLDSYRMLQMLKMEYYMTISEYVAGVALLEKATGADLG